MRAVNRDNVFEEFRELLTLLYGDNIFSDEEFLLLYDTFKTKNPNFLIDIFIILIARDVSVLRTFRCHLLIGTSRLFSLAPKIETVRQLSSLKVQTERHTSSLKNETLWLVDFEEIFNLIPRLFVSLPPFVVVDRKTLVVADHVTTCDSSIAIRVGSTNNINFCRSQLERKKGRRSLVLPVIKPHTCNSSLLFSR